MRQMEIQKLPKEKLNPAVYNPRVDLQPGDAEYEKLLRSVEEFGYVEPVIWNKRTGNIVGGNQRFKVLTQLGFEEIDSVVVDLDEYREKALNVALNKISGEWDISKLYDVVTEIQQGGLDPTLTGYEVPEIDKMYQQVQRVRGEIVEDDFDAEAEAEAIETPVTQLGDVWLLGKHRLMCGDSTDGGTVTKLMNGVKARMVFTDPPWNVDYGGAAHPSWKQRSIKNDNMSKAEFGEFLRKTFRAMASVSELGCMVYIAMSAQEWPNLHFALEENGYHWSSTIIWYKDSPVLSRKDYHTKYEPLWYGWLGGEKRLCPLQDRQQYDVWEIPRPKKSPEHPTMKPVALAARAINNSSRKGDAVLDLFGGSGTTILAAEQTERTANLMELDPRYADTIVQRYIKFTETDAGVYLLRNGERFAYNDVPRSQ